MKRKRVAHLIENASDDFLELNRDVLMSDGAATPARRGRKSRVPSEEIEQTHVIAWATQNQDRIPELHLLYHVPNGGARDKRTGARLKAAGVKSGVPDLHLPVARGGYIGLWVELKRSDRTNHTNDKQNAWIDALRAEGHRVEVCYGASEAKRVIREYLGIGEQE